MSSPHDASNDADRPPGRRRASRLESSAQLRVVFETYEFSGQADNLSEGGVFFFSSDRVRVRVHVEDAAGKRSFVGNLVRIQQMSADESGFAIEFDAPAR